MRKIELIAAISDKTGIPKVDVFVILESLFTEIKEAVIHGNTVSFQTFGTFRIKRRAGRKAQHIPKREGLFVPEHYIPEFIPSKEFKNAVRSKEK